MKEKSVDFYKRLIIFTALLLIVVVAGLVIFFIGNAMDSQNSTEKSKINNDDTVAAFKELEVKITPEAIVKTKKTNTEDSKVVYLTFDDGASANTAEILEVLKENKINATFFFNTGEKSTTDLIVKQAYADGNAIGILTSKGYDYSTIYSSVESYLEDFNKSYDRIQQITGEKPSILRFPGGSINGYDKETYEDLIGEVTSKGLVYFDWNVCAQDGSRNTSLAVMVENATKLPRDKNNCIVLMHDNGNANTCPALEEVIRFYKDNGYVFRKLTADVEPIIF